jgi:hypothetical protein
MEPSKYQNGILNTTEPELLLLREKEQLLKHLDHYLNSFMIDLLYTTLQLKDRFGWILNQALKLKK